MSTLRKWSDAVRRLATCATADAFWTLKCGCTGDSAASCHQLTDLASLHWTTKVRINAATSSPSQLPMYVMAINKRPIATLDCRPHMSCRLLMYPMTRSHCLISQS